ncbi:SGNH/GDSL hydrolase family protein [Breznakiella homolactica]|uniref:SGNH/GDSL hydrolase family protein n=1 Tax=Breznakiella homolactica TaxID=2798577 RepID=A0A7T7XRA7_9SPIR|nr:SGNH/GDSL hydrolase family protein [Breznakiella homolactica]QQO11056.1 SGNH/GDSL hydrolase family protein [Breznakiella homolactica]
MKTILCYGDSNTWGHDPRTGGRYDHKTRWPMVLKQLLNQGAPEDDPAYWIVEEGLGGRTVSRDDPVEGGRNGLEQLLPILNSHRPIDMVVFMLGTNDLKPRFNPTAWDIARSAQRMAEIIRDSRTGPGGESPKVLMICPPPTARSSALGHIFGDSNRLSAELSQWYGPMAGECGALFLDAGKIIVSSEADGIHLDPEDHRKLAAAVADLVSKNL